MKNILMWFLVVLIIAFYLFGLLYLSAKRERCESYGGLLVKDALVGLVCVAKVYVPEFEK